MSLLKLVLGLSGMGWGLFFLLIGFAGEESFGLVFLGLLILAPTVYWMFFDNKERISKEHYVASTHLRLYTQLLHKETYYLRLFEKKQEYLILKELFRCFKKFYDEYGSAVLNAPLQMTRPASPFTAAALGNMVGGAAVGIAAAYTAVQKEARYQQNYRSVIESKLNVGNAYDKVHNCYLSIISIIETNENTKEDWEKVKTSVDNEMNEKYKIK